jgi:hypothetical protein
VYDLIHAGNVRKVQAAEEILIQLGNKDGITFTLNNRPGKPFGGSGNVLKDIRITLDNYEEFIQIQ